MARAKEKAELSSRAKSKLEDLNLTVMQHSTAEKLLAEPLSYMPDNRFRRPREMAAIMAEEILVHPGQTIKPEQEQILFLQMNYTKYKLGAYRAKLLRQAVWQQDDMLGLLDWNRKQLELRSKIVTANMGLVLAMAKHVTYSGVEFGDLISEGSMALLRASEKFDASRGIKFSTYACRAIFKGFSRAAKMTYRYRSRFPAQWDPDLETPSFRELLLQQGQAQQIDELQAILRENLADLSGTELSVVRMRFSLDDSDSPLTLKEVGHKLGLTKERIRQIQNRALNKLREVAEHHIIMG